MYQKIIIKPILTEKMAIMQERQNKYAFIVSSNANKIQIKSAVENKFNVSVSKVSTMNFNGKLKNMTTRSNGKTIRTQGRKSGFKKAIVSLNEGSSIDYLNNSAEVN
jgi:large subunit ribosomal protein L23